jgi:hypothetical protein
MKKIIQLQLTTAEKQLLKEKKISMKSLMDYAPDEITSIIKAGAKRTQEINALIEFQSIPSLGIGFALELMDQGYYSLKQLKGKTAVELFNAYEKHVGAWADPCVEDSYRLLVHYIEYKDESKRWWDFTAERKAYRKQYGFPADRPVKPWYELSRHIKA